MRTTFNFRTKKCYFPLLASYLIATQTAAYAAESITTHNVAVTGNPLGVASDEMVTPVTVLNGHQLSYQRDNSLGELLKSIPGVSASYYGPTASRPIIRGLDNDRVRIMQNGVGVLDASGISPDHAVALDPIVVEQIEVIRGPAALLYGGSAIGGVVNAIDHRIPKEQLDGVTGRYEARYGGADNQRNAGAVIDVGNGLFALHADAYGRKTDDLSIPDYAKIPSLRTNEDIKGKLVNSNAKGSGGALGASLTLENGFAGFSFAHLDNNYGSVAEPTVRIDQQSDRFEGSSEFRELGNLVQSIKFRFAHTDYQHKEIESGKVGTTFKNNGWEGTLEARHGNLGRLSGVIGYQFQDTTFQALGEEAYIPKTDTSRNSLYVYEELPFNISAPKDFKLSAGVRSDQISQSSTGGGKFGNAIRREFSPLGLSLGALFQLNPAWSISSNLSHNERAPNYDELFANGAHIATGQYIIGNQNLTLEKSNGIDAQLRWQSGQHQASISAYRTRFLNYIGTFNTGNKVDGDGNLGGDLNEGIVRAVPATFSGLESQAKFGLYDQQGHLDLTLRGDYIRASDESTGKPLPRIAPAHLGFGLDYTLERFNTKLDVLYGFKQNRTADNETETPSYTQVNLMASYTLSVQHHLDVFAKANNLLDETIREHTSYVKDIAPLAGRALLVGLHGEF